FLEVIVFPGFPGDFLFQLRAGYGSIAFIHAFSPPFLRESVLTFTGNTRFVMRVLHGYFFFLKRF
ncbi:MAG: hypothetical protein K6T65_16705, partial [Peptococcaceae bacterium]|nr:hypothetical protein [Peptococcaceae bacterium]